LLRWRDLDALGVLVVFGVAEGRLEHAKPVRWAVVRVKIGAQLRVARDATRQGAASECDLVLSKSAAKSDHDVLPFMSVLANLIMLDDA